MVSSTMTLMLATHDLASPQVKILTTSIWILGTAFQMPAMPVATSAFVGPGEGERACGQREETGGAGLGAGSRAGEGLAARDGRRVCQRRAERAPCAASQSVSVEAVACSALMPCSSCAFHTRKYSVTAACMMDLM